MQPLVYFRAEAPLITRAYYITRYACHRVTIPSSRMFFSLSLSPSPPSLFLFPTISSRVRVANEKPP